MNISIAKLMDESGVGFGTSGARGLVSAMTDSVCYAYTYAFLQYLMAKGEVQKGQGVAVAGDYRPSSERIMTAVAQAAQDIGCVAVNCGTVPSPAVAYYGIVHGMPAIMVTGSHIPDDRNGIKFNKASGEINKEDEAGIKEQSLEISDTLFNSEGYFVQSVSLPSVEKKCYSLYVDRYIDFFGKESLKGIKLGLYEHSTVGREIMYEIFTGLGADVTKLGFSDTFIPVDTEAIREEDCELARKWAAEYEFTAIASADGDCDRPLLSNEKGEWFRGDVLGVLCSEFLNIEAVATPVSCNTVAEKSAIFKKVERTRIGSPFVIAGMENLEKEGFQRIAGYEANGGYLTQSTFKKGDLVFKALPTRDAVLPIITVLMLAKDKKVSLSALTAHYPARYTASDRLKNFPVEKSREILENINTGSFSGDSEAIENILKGICSSVDNIERTDGARITLINGEIVHLRPSGNAPEFRCYSEADSEERARQLADSVLNRLKEKFLS